MECLPNSVRLFFFFDLNQWFEKLHNYSLCERKWKQEVNLDKRNIFKICKNSFAQVN